MKLNLFNFLYPAKFIFLICFFCFGCNSVYTSKKKGYYHIDLPQHKYVLFDKANFPYTFEYPVYSNIIQDSTYFDSSPENPFWINIDFPQWDARIFLSYKKIGGKAVIKVKQPDGNYKDSFSINRFDKMVNDAFNLTNKNEVQATSIRDSVFHTKNGIAGILFKVGGNAATATQFFMSDTSNHFLRGALYFNSTPNADSVRPVQDFLKTDIDHLINSFKWKDK